MVLQILLNHLFSHLAYSCAEISPCPKMSTPVPFLDIWILFKKLARCSTFNPSHNLTRSHGGLSRDQNMHMILTHSSLDYTKLKRLTCLPNKLSNPFSNFSNQYLVAIFRYPNKVILNVIDRVTAISILHNCLHMIRDSYALTYGSKLVLKADRLKPVVSTLWVEK